MASGEAVARRHNTPSPRSSSSSDVPRYEDAVGAAASNLAQLMRDLADDDEYTLSYSAAPSSAATGTAGSERRAAARALSAQIRRLDRLAAVLGDGADSSVRRDEHEHEYKHDSYEYTEDDSEFVCTSASLDASDDESSVDESDDGRLAAFLPSAAPAATSCASLAPSPRALHVSAAAALAAEQAASGAVSRTRVDARDTDECAFVDGPRPGRCIVSRTHADHTAADATGDEWAACPLCNPGLPIASAADNARLAAAMANMLDAEYACVGDFKRSAAAFAADRQAAAHASAVAALAAASPHVFSAMACEASNPDKRYCTWAGASNARRVERTDTQHVHGVAVAQWPAPDGTRPRPLEPDELTYLESSLSMSVAQRRQVTPRGAPSPPLPSVADVLAADSRVLCSLSADDEEELALPPDYGAELGVRGRGTPAASACAASADASSFLIVIVHPLPPPLTRAHLTDYALLMHMAYINVWYALPREPAAPASSPPASSPKASGWRPRW